MTRRKETLEEFRAIRDRMLAFIAEMRPVAVEPFAKLLTRREYEVLSSLATSGHVMRCTETDRLFVPALCVRA